MNKLQQLLENVGDMALKRRARRIIEELELKEGDVVLDAGCGDGFYLHLLSELGKFKITGLDFDKKALESAKKNLKGVRNVNIMQGSVMELPFKANTFNKVVLTEVAEHLPDDLKGLKEIYRVLKPGGILVLTVPNHNYPFLWDPINKILEATSGKHIKSGFWAGIWNQHIRLYFPDQIAKKVKKAGFSVEEVECVTHYSLPFNHHLLNLAARRLYGGSMNPKIVKEISKFSTKKSKKSTLISVAFKTVNMIDALNNGVTDKSSVSVLVKGRKKYVR